MCHIAIFRVLMASLVYCLLAGDAARAAGALENIRLWPEKAPGETIELPSEQDVTKSTDNRVGGKGVIRLGNVSTPTFTVYPASGSKANGAAVLVCPGGGYHILAMDLEGTEVAEWLNSIGVTAIVLKYRVPVRANRPRYEAPLQDAQRAMGLIRSRASEWHIRPDRIGIMGFSAGAHLSAVTSGTTNRVYDPIDAADRVSCRPDFVMLIYPAYLTVEKENFKIAPELNLSANTPPTFLVQTQDDAIKFENALFYYRGLAQLKIPAELHLYAVGGHGYGLRSGQDEVTRWPVLAEKWLRGLGMLVARD
jgi:acetyl esterase/lipase